MTTSPKKRLITLLLALFVGILGVHRMYVGKVGTGIVQLILTITGIGMFVTVVWVLIDLIVIATGNFRDKQGALIKVWE